MKKFTILILAFICSTVCLAQSREKVSYKYDKMGVNYKNDYNNAKFVVAYVYSEGDSFGDRYSNSVTVTDSLVTLKVVAPDFESYNDADFERQFVLEAHELDSLKAVTKLANLKQLKPGIAHWKDPKYTREVLIVKYDSLQIAGGQTYRSLGAYGDIEPIAVEEMKVEKDKRASSTIGGDYDSIINILKKYFKRAEDPHSVTVSKRHQRH